MTATRPTLIIVSGLSGSGKSVALKTFEDLDYYCVDNLPVDRRGWAAGQDGGGDRRAQPQQ